MRINGAKTAFSAVIWPVWLLLGFFPLESGDPDDGLSELGRHSYSLSGSTDLLKSLCIYVHMNMLRIEIRKAFIKKDIYVYVL